MCDQTEIEYLDGDVVWVKLGSCWWPGEVVGPDRLPPDVLPSFRKPPIAVVKFFQETTYEYVKNINCIYKYNCSRKNEFINKGLYMYRTKHGHMEKFPEDVIRAETAVGGDIEILTRDEFQEVKKESYVGIFGETSKKTPASGKRGRGRKRREPSESPKTPKRFYAEKSDYKAHILVQASTPIRQSTETRSTPSTSRAGSEVAEEKSQKLEKAQPPTTPSTPANSSSGIYSCHSCPFTTTRLNVLILHNKTHSSGFVPYTPSPVRKKVSPKSTTKTTEKSPKTTKTPRPRKEKSDKTTKPASAKKRSAEEKPKKEEIKKPKTEQEIKSSLLADWDDVDEESADETALPPARSPEVPLGAESPAAPTPAELPTAHVPIESSSSLEKKSDDPPLEKPESSSDSKYEFCEDEDWPVEADVGRRIPRIKPSKRRDEAKSISLDDEDVAKEVAELLNKTTVPELPSVPEPLKAEENFPEPPVIKSPDKKPDSAIEGKNAENITETKPTKAIFKTKTFFRSRHSRSQDAIGKYVAEQLNAAGMDLNDSEINGSEPVSSPETRDSSPVEPVKVARLAPKIQLKKMKAEAAQFDEMDRSNIDHLDRSSKTTEQRNEKEMKDTDKILQDALYPAQVIKPVTKEIPDKLLEDFKEHSRKAEGKNDIYNQVIVAESSLNKLVSLTDLNTTKIIGQSPKQVKKVYRISTFNATGEDVADVKTPSVAGEDFADVKIPSVASEDVAEVKIPSVSGEDVADVKTPSVAGEDVDIKTPPAAGEDFADVKTPSAAGEYVPDIKTPFAAGENVADVTTPSAAGEDVADGKIPFAAVEDITDGNKVSKQVLEQSASMKVSHDEINNKLSGQVLEKPVSMEVEHDEIMFYQSHPQVTSVILPNNSPKSSPVKSLGTHQNCLASKFETVKSFEELKEPYMSESTASAVDALLSVSRDADRVTRIVSDDLPEDLFEDDNKDGTNNENICSDNGEFVNQEVEQDKPFSENINNNENSQKESIFGFEKSILAEPCKTNTSQTNMELNVNLVGNAENVPSESDLQIAEALINLPSTTIHNKSNELKDNVDFQTFSDDTFVEEQVVATTETEIDPTEAHKSEGTKLPVQQKEHSNNEALNVRYETELEQSENLNAAQSLVQMSEFYDPKVSKRECKEEVQTEASKAGVFKQNNGIDISNTVEQNVALLASENNSESSVKSPKFETTSSKLLKILEEPPTPKSPVKKPATPTKQLVVTGKEKILNLDVAKAPKGPAPKQKIIIRRSASSKTIINNLKDVMTSPDKIILSRNTVQDGSAVQTFTIQTTPDSSVSTITTTDPKQIIIQPKHRKVTKPTNKVQKIKPHNSLISDMSEPKHLNEAPDSEEPIFDINSMPVVLSDDILTPESIEKMPIVMSDGNIITNTPNPPKVVKTKPVVETEKIVTITNEKIVKSISSPSKPEMKTLVMNPVSDVNKATTPNILSKSSKLRGAKPMLVIDKATGKQKIIMTKGEPVVKEIKQAPSLIQAVSQTAPKAEKFILLPSASSPVPRPGRTQKIVIDPQTGKAHVLVTKGQETSLPVPDNKPVSAKLIPSSSDASSPGNTVMIITNAQGTQSRIVLTPEHEKILFPNKQPNVSQLKTITHRISTTSGVAQKTVVTSAAPVKTQTKIVPKQQKSAIITSKGQLIVGGRVATTAQNIAPMPEIRQVPTKRIITTEPKKLIQAVQKNSSEPLIFLQQKSGAVMQLTAAQFEHLQRTGQIVQRAPAPVQENKIVVQKSITISPKETVKPVIQKQHRVRKTATEASTPAKRLKKEMAISSTTVASPAPAVPAAVAHALALPPAAPVAPPPLAPIAGSVPTITITPMVPDVSNTVSINTSSAYPDLDNFEELLPSTAIVRQPEITPPRPEPLAPPEPATPAPSDVTSLGGTDTGFDPAAAAIAENQLLAVPGENLGGLPGSFYLCIEENGKFTPIDNRPLILENNQLVPMSVEPAPAVERRDILEAALANSDVFAPAAPRDDAPDFRDLNANVSVHCRVSETSTTLNQPIMTPAELPPSGEGEPAVPASLEAGLAVIGVTPHAVPTSLELPITVTDPRIAPKTTDPLSGSTYGGALLPSPSTEMFVSSEETAAGGISMPLLAEEGPVGKSMPLLTDEVAVSSVESAEGAEGSPGAGPRRLRTPASDTSDNSAEIPLQPALQLRAADLASAHS